MKRATHNLRLEVAFVPVILTLFVFPVRCQVTLEKLSLDQANSRYDVQMEYVLPGEGSRFVPEDTIVSAAAKVSLRV
jgi:hypothetical protein